MQYKNLSSFSLRPQFLLLILCASFLASCSTVSPLTGNLQSTSANASNSISGIVIENDGATPVYGATVAILSGDVQIQPENASSNNKDMCSSPSQAHIAYTCTIEDGSFTLNLSQVRKFPVTMRIETSHESKEITLTAKELNTNMGMITLTSETAELKEKVAVVMDFYNPLEDIQEFLSENPSQTQQVKLQLMQEYQNLYQIGSEENEIMYPTFFSLFKDGDKDGKADIFNYDVVYINSRQKSDIALLDQSIRKELLNFISNGGSLFITEWTVQLEAEEPTPDQFI